MSNRYIGGASGGPPNEYEEFHGYSHYWEKIVDKTLSVTPWLIAAFAMGVWVGYWWHG